MAKIAKQLTELGLPTLTNRSAFPLLQSRLPTKRTLLEQKRRAISDTSFFMIQSLALSDFNLAAHLHLLLHLLGQLDGEDAVLDASLDLVFFHVIRQNQRLLEL